MAPVGSRVCKNDRTGDCGVVPANAGIHGIRPDAGASSGDGSYRGAVHT